MPATELDEREALLAAEGAAVKRDYVRRIFSEIAPRYDLLNHLLSFNIDRRWRARAIGELGIGRRPDGLYVDLCAGTLDVSAQLAATPGFRGLIVGADFAEPMLRAGRAKVAGRAVSPVTADALALPLADGSASGAIVAFGIRNVADLGACAREVHRVLEPGGRFVILEFTTPPSAAMRLVYHAYFHNILPLVGRMVSGHATAYRYLPESVKNFPEERELARRLESAGFPSVRWSSLTFGIAAVHVAEKR